MSLESQQVAAALRTLHRADRIQVRRAAGGGPILVQHAPTGRRPYIHPLRAPDGRGCLTEVEPGHHPWQHGLYVGLHGVNGLDFWSEGLGGGGEEREGRFHPRPLEVPAVDGNAVSWRVVTDWRTPTGGDILVERQAWTLTDLESTVVLDVEWRLEAVVDVEFKQHGYGGLFLRMPYRPDVGGAALDSEGRDRAGAEGKRSRWVAVSMPVPPTGTDAGVAMLDHPSNPVHPSPWRVDGALGVSPSRCILGDWRLSQGASSCERYRLVCFNGATDRDAVEAAWREFASS